MQRILDDREARTQRLDWLLGSACAEPCVDDASYLVAELVLLYDGCGNRLRIGLYRSGQFSEVDHHGLSTREPFCEFRVTI